MKITKRSTPEKESSWIGTCHTCNSEAEAVYSEMNNIVHDQKEGTEHSWETCPVCHAKGWGAMLFYRK